jgi:hypothetical protein
MVNPCFITSDDVTEEHWVQRKVLTAFWDAQGILLLQFLDHGATLNADHY